MAEIVASVEWLFDNVLNGAVMFCVAVVILFVAKIYQSGMPPEHLQDDE